MITKAVEDYLKTIYQLEAESGEVSTNLLADRLNLTAASVTGMVKRLASLRLISHTPYQGVSLTDEGRVVALRVLRYHRLAERYLADVLGLPWDEVHAEAEEWEHVLSERVAGRLDEALGGPRTDPHGDPIPAADGWMEQRHERPLASLPAGAAAVVTRVHSQDPALLRYLGSLGLYPGVALVVAEVAPFEGPISVTVGTEQLVIGRPVAQHVFVDEE